jgi:hypothetical protein
MFDHSTLRPGYSVLLAPAYWFVDTGEGIVRAALTLNALLAGVSAMILARLLVRWTTSWRRPDGSSALRPSTVAAIAVAVAVSPAAIASSAYTWAEAMVTCTFLATVWSMQRFVDSGRLAHAIVATGAAAVAMTTHGRSLALLPTVILVAAAILAARRRWAAAAAVTGVGILLGLVSLRFTGRVHDAVWDDPSEINTPGSVIERLDAPVALADSFVGQAWYQLVASAGLIGVGTAVVLGSLWRRGARLDRSSAGVLVALTTPLVMTSVTFMADRERSDQLVYGRYVDAIVWPLVALGMAVVASALVEPGQRRTRVDTVIVSATAITCGTFGLIVAWRHGDQLAGDVGLRMMVPGLLPHIGGADGVPVLRITATTIAVLVAMILAMRRRLGRTTITWIVVVSICGVAWAGMRVHDAQAQALNTWAIGDEVARIDEIVPDGEAIGVLFVPDDDRPRVPYAIQRQRAQVYQLYLFDHELVLERTPRRIGAQFVLAPAGTAVLVDAGATVRWGDPRVRMALWELPDRTDGARTRVPSAG